jgi:large subunit ribosomal protein L6
MSKIGKKIINIPDGLKIEIKDGMINFQNSKGEILTLKILPGIVSEVQDKNLFFTTEGENRQTKVNWGTMRSLANNAILGLSQGFSKILELEGVGYRANLEGDDLVLKIGFSHLVRYHLPKGIKVEIIKNSVKISGFDKILVGKVAAEIRDFKKPEPYKGKGIRYQGEIIKRKAGKKAEAVAGAGAPAKK